jgi:hypothetical protein
MNKVKEVISHSVITMDRDYTEEVNELIEKGEIKTQQELEDWVKQEDKDHIEYWFFSSFTDDILKIDVRTK